MISPEFSTAATLLLYAVAGVGGFAGMLFKNAKANKVGIWAAVAGFAFQTLGLFLGMHGALGMSAGMMLQMLAWFIVLAGLGLKLFLKQNPPLFLSSLLALILYGFSAPALRVMAALPASLHTSFYAVHAGALFLSIALVLLGAAAGVAFLCIEGRIKRKMKLPGFLKDMPALKILDKINAVATLAGFPLFTCGMVLGLFKAASLFGGTMTGDPKQITSLLVWILFAVNFHNRLTKGWQGRKPAKLMIAVCVLCLFSFFVVNVFMPSHHAFIGKA